MPESDASPTPTSNVQPPPSRPPKPRPPCKRCGNRDWTTETRRKSFPRWLLETVFAVPDVLIYQSESAGWPSRTYERWTCTNCGRKVRVPAEKS